VNATIRTTSFYCPSSLFWISVARPASASLVSRQAWAEGPKSSGSRRMLLDLLDVVKEDGAKGNNPALVLQWIAEDLLARLPCP